MKNVTSSIFYKIRKLTIFLMIISLLTVNSAFAITPEIIKDKNYLKIETSSNKIINIELSTVQFCNDILTFSTIYDKKNNYQINIININIKDKTANLVKQEIYNYNHQLLKSIDYPKGNQYIPIKEDSLMQDLYEVAVILNESIETFNNNPEVWEEYFKKIANKVYKKYHPNIFRWLRTTKPTEMYVVLVLNKNGSIESFQYYYVDSTDKKYKEFDNKYKAQITKILKNDKIFAPLPKEYKANKLILRFYFGFDKNYENLSFKLSNNSKGTGVIDIEKNSTPILTLPVVVFQLGVMTVFVAGSALCISGLIAINVILIFFPSKIADKIRSKLNLQ